ncbi:hypothetical protein PIB30_018786 [Stylosanthes scabra]|uniref:MBD domain-containing protein n=1 Tax=Stylosanthes scabra TaxID=79078 RepID=A0ABU6R8J1_9FABA|nr:hypothetical protein [Stylosanthes scabra]
MADEEETNKVADPIPSVLPTDEKEQSKEASTPLDRLIPSEKNAIVLATPMSWTPIQTQSGNVTTGGESSSKPRKSRTRKSLPQEWLANYDIITKPRNDGGRVDKFYHHKHNKEIKFRSMKEVERYETYGVRPSSRKKKQLHIENANENITISPKTHANEKEAFIDMIEKASEEERKRMVEGFLSDARQNLEHSFDNNPDAASTTIY